MSLAEPLRRRAFSFGTWVLGIVFCVAAVLKAIDLTSFSEQLGRYNLISSHFTGPAAALIVVLEASLGMCALLGLQTRRTLWAMLLLLGLFTGATALSWKSLEGTKCNCFGRFYGGDPASILLQDAVLASVALLLLAAGRKLISTSPDRRWLRATMGLSLITAAAFAAQPAPAIHFLRDGSQTGDQIRVFLSATCRHCRESLGKVQELAQTPSLPPVVIFIGAENEKELAEFLKSSHPPPGYTPLTVHQLGGFVSRVPTVQIVRDGRLRIEWPARVPSITEVRGAIGKLPRDLE